MTAIRAGFDDILPFIIGAIWVIAQIAGAAAKKKTSPLFRMKPQSEPFRVKPQGKPRPVQRDGREPARRPEPANDPFADLLRQIAGVEEFKVPEPQFVEETPDVHPWKPGKIEARPDAQPSLGFQALETPVANIKPPEIELTAHPKMSGFRSSIPSIKLPTMPSMKLRIDTPSYVEASRGKQGIGSELSLKDRKALRRAMLSHIIFSPPKALEIPDC